MSSARFVIGDSLTVLRSLPDASVDLVLSSPPFLALRSYLPPDHPDKALEMGSEATPGEFIDALLTITEECRRVLAPHGSLCFELGDTYAGSGGAGGDYNDGGVRDGQPVFRGSAAVDRKYQGSGASKKAKPGTSSRFQSGAGWPLDKSLCLIPELFRIALVYGFNPLTGRTTPRWRARNVVRWCRPNPPVGALADKVRPATSDMVVACTSRRRYFDLDAVRHEGVEPGAVKRKTRNHSAANPRTGWMSDNAEIRQNPNGAPPLDHWWHDEDTFDQDAWLISTEPYKGSHYATWPTELCVKPIEAMCPRRVCLTCGKPSERIVESQVLLDGQPTVTPKRIGGSSGGVAGSSGVGVDHNRFTTERSTVGWSDCGHGAWRPGVTLDPFAGSGTTLAVATGHGRDAIGIDLDERNAELAARRVGMWLTVERFAAEATA